jgi:hypothetical protein
MEMEMEVKDEISMAFERMSAAAEMLEQAVERMVGVELQASLERVSAREAELEEKLAQAEQTIAALKASTTRKTLATGAFAAKDGGSVESGSLDAALTSLSVEQRIAVKAGLMRGGLLG